MKRKKTKLNLKRIFFLIFFLTIIITGYFFVKYRFFIVDNSTIDHFSDLIISNPITSEYEDISLKNNPAYSGIRKMRSGWKKWIFYNIYSKHKRS